MKKCLAVLCAAALLCGCSSKNKGSAGGNSGEAPTLPPTTAAPSINFDYEYPVSGTDTDMSEVSNVDWSLIYRDAISEFRKTDKCDETARFTIYDINNDMIPELFISYGSDDDKTYLVKSLSDENIYTEYDPISDGGEMFFSMNRSLLVIFFYDFNTQTQTAQLYRLKNSKLANVYTFEMSGETYKMNGEECTEEEYMDEYNLLLNGVIKDMGTDFAFDDDSIDAALGNKATMEEGYAAVVNSYLKQMEGNANVKSSYSIMDVNGDEIPELFVSEGVAFSPSVDVFSWNGCVVPVGNFGTDGVMYYYPSSGELKGEYHAPSYTAGCFYKFNEQFKFEELFSFGDTEVSNSDDIIYNINAESKTADEYHKIMDEHSSGDSYVLGADNDVTAENISLLKEGKFTAPSLKAS